MSLFQQAAKAADGEGAMVMLDRYFRFLFTFWIFASAVALSHTDADAQMALKKVRLGIAATSVGFLPIYTAYHRGFYKDEAIDTSKLF
jgi:ABC-type nitrate/sulfonate/bicarbonate transport system substrate-binding protein